jgi:chromosome condensin MukBEF ATPase and DNA-binding subunit MukB
MELVIGIVVLAIVGYLVLRKKPEVVQEIVEEVKAVEKKAEVAITKVEEEVKEVAKKTTARAKKALDVNQDGKVDAKDAVAIVKKARKPRAPKA